MTKTVTIPFDAAEFLDSNESIAVYLSEALESGDAAHVQEALQTVARARGMTKIAEDSGLGRESLYKALRPDANPRFDTVMRVMQALGVSLSAEPIKARQAASRHTSVKRRARKGGAKPVVTTAAKPSPARRRHTAQG